jgi:hypothetical protein
VDVNKIKALSMDGCEAKLQLLFLN